MLQFPDRLITNSDIIYAFNQNKTPLRFLPAERWEYNNVNFCIAALIAKKYQNYLLLNILNSTFSNQRK